MKIVPNATAEAVMSALAARLVAHLSKNIPTLFLASGGACGEAAVGAFSAVSRSLSKERGRLRMLFSLALADERLGETGHQGSNWRQLLEGGLDAGICNAVPILSSPMGEGNELEETANRYNAFLAQAVKNHAEGKLYVACLLGMGEDGHIAGILPNSPASLMDESETRYAVGYHSALFPRVTITPAFFKAIDYAAIWVSSHSTIPALDRLAEDLPTERFPAQLVKKVAESEIFAEMELPERILKRA